MRRVASYQPLRAVEERLKAANNIILPLVRAGIRVKKLWSIVRGAVTPVRSWTTRDYTIVVIEVQLPASKPLIVAYYVSVQKSRPLSPSQLHRRLQRLRSILSKLTREELPYTRDTLYALHAPAGLTRGAKRLAYHHMLLTGRSPREIAAKIASYISRRYNRLVEKIRGRPIWGELPLLAYTLATIAAELGAQNTKPPNTLAVLEALQGKAQVIT